MILPTFTLINAPPDTLILHTREYPYHFAKVLRYPGGMAVGPGKLIQERVTGYNIFIALAGSLNGKIHLSADGPGRLQQLVRDMAAWYANEHVFKQETKFKKYKL